MPARRIACRVRNPNVCVSYGSTPDSVVTNCMCTSQRLSCSGRRIARPLRVTRLSPASSIALDTAARSFAATGVIRRAATLSSLVARARARSATCAFGTTAEYTVRMILTTWSSSSSLPPNSLSSVSEKNSLSLPSLSLSMSSSPPNRPIKGLWGDTSIEYTIAKPLLMLRGPAGKRSRVSLFSP
eukprot:1194154-Prorocentrum_minimum.AAC.3